MKEIFNSTFKPGRTGFVVLEDGSYMAVKDGLTALYSEDRGITWEKETSLIDRNGSKIHGKNVGGVLRLNSGKIAICYLNEVNGSFRTNRHRYDLFFRTSEDEGKTWEDEVQINLPGMAAWPYYDTMIQTSGGRILLPVRWCFEQQDEEPSRVFYKDGNYPGGEILPLLGEGHAHFPEIDITFVYFSDDEGNTWDRSEHDLFVWLEDGYKGAYACDEPTLAECANGELILFMRSTIGRVVEARSIDGGRTWTRAQPNRLLNSYSPVRIRQIPKTGDLHAVWNEVTPEEIRKGFRRSRLTSAISKDNGYTWKCFKLLDCYSGLKAETNLDGETGFVISENEKIVNRYLETGEGRIEGYCVFRYPNIRYAGDKVYITYDRESMKTRSVIIRAFQLELLYEKEPWDLRLPNNAPLEGGNYTNFES